MAAQCQLISQWLVAVADAFVRDPLLTIGHEVILTTRTAQNEMVDPESDLMLMA